MKNTTRILLLIFVLVFSVSAVAFAARDVAPTTDTLGEIVFGDRNQDNAILAFNILLDDFGHDEEGFPIYPDNCGGAYYDGEKLVIQLTEGSEDTERYIADLLTGYPIGFETVSYSYNALQQLGTAFVGKFDASVKYCGVRSRSNSYVIAVSEGDKQTANAFNAFRTLSSIPIEIEVTGENESYASLVGGDKLYHQEGNAIVGVKMLEYSLGFVGPGKEFPWS